jgi:ABC-type phosphate transport system substrate-binding protein
VYEMMKHEARRKAMNVKTGSRFLLVGLVMVLLGLSGSTYAKTVVIANDDVDVRTIDKRELQKVFLGRTSELGGQRVVLATLREGISHKEFTENYLQMTPQQFTNHWRKIVFSGTGKEPTSFDSEAELVKFVSKTPGAIGYVSGSTTTNGVKRLDVN